MIINFVFKVANPSDSLPFFVAKLTLVFLLSYAIRFFY